MVLGRSDQDGMRCEHYKVAHTAFVQLGLNGQRSSKGVNQIYLFRSQDTPYLSGVSNLSEANVQ